MNALFVLGKLTKNPEKINGTKNTLVKLNLADENKSTNAQGKKPKQFFNVFVWSTMADNCLKYLKRGSKIAIFGYTHTNSWKDKNGKLHYSPIIIATEIEYISTPIEKPKPIIQNKENIQPNTKIEVQNNTPPPFDDIYPDNFLI